MKQEQKPCRLLTLPSGFCCHGGYSYQPLFAVAAAKVPKPANRSLCMTGPVTNRTKSYKLSL